MKTILKKNQVIISVIAIMLIAAGYMNYTANTKETLQAAALTDTEKYADLGDATLVSANVQENSSTKTTEGSVESEENSLATKENDKQNNTNNIQNENNLETSLVTTNTTNTTNTSSSTTSNNQYFTESRLEREKMYSQMLESYQNILSNTQISDTQKEIAQNEIVKINTTKNAIMITENLIKNKGFEDIVIFVNGDSISIVIKAKELSQEQIAQIQNIVSRELKGDIENIHISSKE